MNHAPRDPATVLAETERAQAKASDPTVSAWVSANAGAGKTHVLKSRVLRILLAGTAPDRILCLTYTKAAAAEMAGRVFKDLSQWATASTSELERALGKLLARNATADEIETARTLFARAIETPGGLKVQTIHAFCERLLQRFPLEAGVPPGFAILDGAEGARLVRGAIDAVLAEATRAPVSRLGKALGRMVGFAASEAFDIVLGNALAQREWLDAMVRLTTHQAGGEAAAEALYRRTLGIEPALTLEEVEAQLVGILPMPALRRSGAVLRDSDSKTDGRLGEALIEAATASTAQARSAALARAFLTKDGEARSDRGFVTQKVRASSPEVHPQLARARDRFATLEQQRLGLLVVEATLSLMRLAGDAMQRYTAAKQLRAALDFQDLIEHTARLLSDAEAAAWVLMKLDGGLDHILVDEAQDTSPLQWRVIEALAAEFFPVTGGGPKPRTIFAVGDEKQSIYSFQGADPRKFAETGEHFRRNAEAARLALARVPLTLSFRTVEPLLEAVDRILASPERTPGLTAGGGEIRHVARRIGHAGCLEIWETEQPEELEESDPYSPLAERPIASPVTRLADRIAGTIAGWLERGEMLASEGRPVREGDILILLRRRNPFAGPIVGALKKRKIAVAGADRLRLTEQIAVQDLMVLGDFLTLPEDELALATVLKSPLFGLDDDDLMRLAVDRKGKTLWSRLLALGRTEARLAEAADTLRRWRGIADQAPPFELLAHVLDRDGGRKKLIGRLGPEAVDTLTELLNLAIEFDEAETPSLTGFLQWMRAGAREIKRDMEHGRNEVRVLTVHGAKGLEAPIVFLPDTCSGPGATRQGGLVALAGSGLAAGVPDALAWPVKGTSKLAAIRDARDAAKAAEREEANRLLYVAMTRARDRLYVCGWEGRRPRPNECWYEIIAGGLDGLLTPAHDAAGRPVRRLESAQSAPPAAALELAAATTEAQRPPGWSERPAPREPRLAVPLAPSRLAPYDIDEEGDPVPPRERPDATPPEPATPSPIRLAGSSRFQRGLLTHALLEHLPGVDPARRQAAAKAFVASRGHALPARVQTSIISEVLALLAAPRFAAAFGPDSRAEVPVVAEIPDPSGRGPPLRLNTVIDRLVIGAREITIIDYKTNRPPPAEPSGVATAYLVQLAAYRLALQQIHPGRDLLAAILWTDGARLMEIPPDLLTYAEGELWRLSRARLDA